MPPSETQGPRELNMEIHATPAPYYSQCRHEPPRGPEHSPPCIILPAFSRKSGLSVRTRAPCLEHRRVRDLGRHMPAGTCHTALTPSVPHRGSSLPGSERRPSWGKCTWERPEMGAWASTLPPPETPAISLPSQLQGNRAAMPSMDPNVLRLATPSPVTTTPPLTFGGACDSHTFSNSGFSFWLFLCHPL